MKRSPLPTLKCSATSLQHIRENRPIEGPIEGPFFVLVRRSPVSSSVNRPAVRRPAARERARGPGSLHGTVRLQVSGRVSQIFQIIIFISDFLGNLQPSRTTTQKTRGALGVELADGARRKLSSDGSNISGGGMRAEL